MENKGWSHSNGGLEPGSIWDLQLVSDKCLSKFRAKKMAFFIGLTGMELGNDPY